MPVKRNPSQTDRSNPEFSHPSDSIDQYLLGIVFPKHLSITCLETPSFNKPKSLSVTTGGRKRTSEFTAVDEGSMQFAKRIHWFAVQRNDEDASSAKNGVFRMTWYQLFHPGG
jgi:hypothetical protein